MLAVLSPAKTLAFERDPQVDRTIDELGPTDPAFAARSAKLVTRLRSLGRDGLQALMGISEDLAELNHRRYREWRRDPEHERTRAAILAFRGDVYRGLDADAFSADDFGAAQARLRILSGLYGLLRPLDRIQAHRLEMGTPLESPLGRDLYAAWGAPVTAALRGALDERAAAGATPVLVNLASNEYAKVIRTRELGVPVITPVFRETKDGKARTLALFAKQARGMMAAFIVRERIDDPAGLAAFRGGGYRFRAGESNDSTLVFSRPQPAPPAAKSPGARTTKRTTSAAPTRGRGR